MMRRRTTQGTRRLVNFINTAQRCAGVAIAIRYGQTHFLASVCICFSSHVVFQFLPILQQHILVSNMVSTGLGV